jgi:Domain of unknown function (DUF1818)
MSQRFLKEGDGWRLGWNPAAKPYKALIGGHGWAIELTLAEFKDFFRLTKQLVEAVKSMQSELMDQELLTCEAESELLWLEVEGYPEAYSLRLLLNQGRRCEGTWSKSAVPSLLEALSSFELQWEIENI